MPVTPVNPVPAPEDTSSLAAGGHTASIILNDIFSKILNMIGTLQNAAASQANRLTFLSGWQKAYTTLASDVPVFTSGSGAFGGASDDKLRGELNQLNSNYTATIQNRQSVVSDDAKALQSNVNQSNDAVNQQSNLGTAILQELGTLLAAIFK